MTNEVRLRDVVEDDLPIFYEHQREPEAIRMAAFPPRELDAFTAHWIKVLSDRTITKKTILFDGHVAGNVVSFEKDGQRLVGYWVGKEHWGKGIATKALSAFVSLVKARPLYAHVAKHNVASIRVLEKCGFTVWGSDTGDDGIEEVILRLDAESTSPH